MKKNFFKLTFQDKNTAARAGVLETPHGTIETPIFMPVGTAGSVKSLSQQHLYEQVHAQIILGNTYHLYLRPQTKVLEACGGLHKFMGWDRPILTDSGGFQIFSLKETRKISQKGVQFKSIIDGSSHFFSPESVMETQYKIGADIIMAFDECLALPATEKEVLKSMELTHQWYQRCAQYVHNTPPLYQYPQTLFPIIQGGVYETLRKASCDFLSSQAEVGIAIGGLSVGEPTEQMYATTAFCCQHIPPQKARYLMGVGMPANILECISLGIDMFDCVIPTRNGRNGMLFTTQGIINIKNQNGQQILVS